MILLNQTNFPNNKILYWKDKYSGFIYESDKEYKIEGDINLLAVFDSNKKTEEEEEGENKSSNKSNKVILIVAICIIAVFILLVIAFLIRRHFNILKLKNGKKLILKFLKQKKLITQNRII